MDAIFLGITLKTWIENVCSNVGMTFYKVYTYWFIYVFKNVILTFS